MATESQIYAIGTCVLGIIANRITLCAICYTKYERPIMTLIMQNKPNLLYAQMNVSSVITKNYENSRLRRRAENKPKQNQFNRVNPRNPWLGISELLNQSGPDLVEKFEVTELLIVPKRIWKRLPLPLVKNQCNLSIHLLADIDTVREVLC